MASLHLPRTSRSQGGIGLPEGRSCGRPVLHQGGQLLQHLPFTDCSIGWSADASQIYFYGGATIQGDAWNLLGVLSLRDLSIRHVTLKKPTESVHVCVATGHVFTGDPVPNKSGGLEAETVEYDAELKSPHQIQRPLPGEFSARCQYVASEGNLTLPGRGEKASSSSTPGIHGETPFSSACWFTQVRRNLIRSDEMSKSLI